MDDTKATALVLFGSLLFLWAVQGKQIRRLQREVDLIVKGDLETLRLKRKLDGYPDSEDG